MVHEYETFNDLVRGILGKRPQSRNNIRQLQQVVWSEAQDLDLNKWSDYSNRIDLSTVRIRAEESQVGECFCPPTDSQELVNRFRSYSKPGRMYHGLQEHVEDAADFYGRQGSLSKPETLSNEVELPEYQKPVEQRYELIKEEVAETGV